MVKKKQNIRCYLCPSEEDLEKLGEDFYICNRCLKELHSGEVYTYNPFEE